MGNRAEATLLQHRAQIPALANKRYFNYGGQGPMAQSALEAVFAAHQHIQTDGPFSAAVNGWLQSEAALTRQVLAQVLGVDEGAMTLTEDVTVGCNIPLWGLPWQAGDHVLMSDCEHPGIIMAMREISRRYGVDVSVFPILPKPGAGSSIDTTSDEIPSIIATHLRPTTRLVIISHILWNTGQVLPLKVINDLCHAHSIRVLVDAAQSVGMLPLELGHSGTDFYAFTGHKWLCGPAGLGGLYVSAEARAELSPTYIGWRGIEVNADGQPTDWKPDGRRFEIATSDGALPAGLRAAIDYQNTWGTPQQRYFRITQLSSYLWGRLHGLRHITCLLKTPPESGLVSFQITPNGIPSPSLHRQLVQQLEGQNIHLRTLLSPSCVRACTHYFTLESELDQLVDAIEAFLHETMA
ncbi:MAG: aminotransferase class V-fold PLP-dependent enzyme [Cyanobacteria bacterium J06554_6]